MDEVLKAGLAATRGWRRLGEYFDPIYVRNINGEVWLITDVRGYREQSWEPGWLAQPYEEWNRGQVYGGRSYSLRTLAEAKDYAAGATV
jgi:hypothetical protein